MRLHVHFDSTFPRLLFAVLIMLVAMATFAGNAEAQVCEDVSCDTQEPTVTVSGGSVVNPNNVTLTITWCDNNALVGSTKHITLNGTDITSQFNFAGISGPCQDDAESTASVNLAPGTNVIVATIEDYVGHIGTGIGYYIVLSGGVEVAPKGDSVIRPISSTLTDSFTVTNIGVNSATFNLASTCTGVTSSCSAMSSVTLASGADSVIPLSYQSSATVGTGTVRLRARLSTDTTVADSGSIILTSANSLLVDVSMTNNDARNTSSCAYQCFAAIHTVSTVPYFSLDQPRNVTLVSSSDWNDRYPQLHFDITHMAGADPNITDYVLTIEDSVGPTQLRLKAHFYQGDYRPVRYSRNNNDATGRPFRMSTEIIEDSWLKSKPTGIYTLNVYIKANRSGYSETDTIRVPFLHVREPAGYVARGWYVADLQRLHVSTGGRAIITEGNGSAYVFSGCGVVGTCSSPTGDFTRLRRDSAAAGVYYTRSYADSSRIWFSTAGLMDSSATAWGVKTRFKYDGAGRITRIYDPYRKRPDSTTVNTHIEFVYSTSPHQVEIRPPKADGSLWDSTRVSILRLNTDTSLRAVVHPDGDSTRFIYHDALFGFNGRKGNINSVTNRNGTSEVLYFFDGQNGAGKLTSVTTASTQYYEGGVTWNNNQAYSVLESWERQNLPGGNTMWNPHPMQRADTIRAKFTDPGGDLTRTRHDKWGQILEVISMNYQGVDGGQIHDTTTFYRSALAVDSVRHPAGAVDRYWYSDQGGRPVVILSAPAAQDATSYDYDEFGQVSRIIGIRTVTQQFYRDTAGSNPLKLDSTRVAGAYKTTFAYDSSFGRLTSTTDASGQHTVSYAYDTVSGNHRRTQQPGARVDSAIFDAYGRDSIIASHGNVKRVYNYDRLNRLTLDSLVGDTLATRYFAPSTEKEFFTHMVDPKGQLHKRAVNARGWTVRIHDPSDTTKYDSLMYNHDGHLSGHLNRRGQRVTYQYNEVHRLITKTATSNVTPDTIKYGYIFDTGNRIRQLTVASNAISNDSIIADTLGWVEKVITNVGSGSARRRFVREYSRTPYFALSEIFMKIQLPTTSDTVNGEIGFCKRRFGRDTASKSFALDTLTPCLNYESPIRITRNSEGMPSGRVQPYSSQSFDYTTRHELYYRGFSPSGLDTLARTYAYGDSLGRITEMSWLDGSGTNTQVRKYSYTKRGELARVFEGTLPVCSPPTGGFLDNGFLCSGTLDTTRVLRFAYDHASNLVSQLDSLPNVTTSATYQGTRLTGWAGTSYTYDVDGNDTTRASGGNTTYFTFTADGRLSQVRLGSDTVVYDYNALGQLVRRKRSGKADRLFFWDGDQLIAEIADSSGVQRVAEYVYWPGIDRPLAIVTGATSIGALRYYAQDEMGNVHGVWSEGHSGVSLTQQLEYDPWGTVVAITGTLADTSRLRWKGTIWEGGITNLYYMRNRWYDPESRRFLGEDPLRAGASLYAFADNDPLNYSDPSGARACDPGEWSHSDWSGTGSPGAMQWEEFTHWCPMGGSMRPERSRGPALGPHPLGDGGSAIGPARPGPSKVERGAACTAAAIDFATAFVTDLVSVTGIGMVATKGTQGARLAIKAARAARWHFMDRAGGGFLPRNGRLGTLGKWSAGAIAAGGWEVTSHAAQGKGFNWLEEVGELVPGINSYLQGRDAVRACL